MPRHSHPVRVAPGVALLVACSCTGLFHPRARGADPEPIAWRDDYAAALEEAGAAHRLLWIQFTGPWCSNCTRMERDSFPHPAIVRHARDSFIPVKLRCDVNEQLAQSLNLTGLPATVIVAPTREIVACHEGYLGPSEFDAFLRDSLARRPRARTGESALADAAAAPARDKDNGSETAIEPLAMDGFCAVSLVRDRKLVAGNSQYTIRHGGRAYRFASLELFERFRSEPARYVPANDGYCPVNKATLDAAVPGDAQFWRVVRGAPVPVRHPAGSPAIPRDSRRIRDGRRRRIRLLRSLHPRVRAARQGGPSPRARAGRPALLVSRHHTS